MTPLAKGAQPEQLVERARALSAKATPGPWNMWAGIGWPESMKRILGIGDGEGVIWPVAGEAAPVENGEPKEYVAGVMTSHDQAFIAQARELVPALATALSECLERDGIARTASALVDVYGEYGTGSEFWAAFRLLEAKVDAAQPPSEERQTSPEEALRLIATFTTDPEAKRLAQNALSADTQREDG